MWSPQNLPNKEYTSISKNSQYNTYYIILYKLNKYHIQRWYEHNIFSPLEELQQGKHRFRPKSIDETSSDFHPLVSSQQLVAPSCVDAQTRHRNLSNKRWCLFCLAAHVGELGELKGWLPNHFPYEGLVHPITLDLCAAKFGSHLKLSECTSEWQGSEGCTKTLENLLYNQLSSHKNTSYSCIASITTQTMDPEKIVWTLFPLLYMESPKVQN